nr:MAG TPA: hypothetical protein [Bacteriophage sp.]
MFRRAFYAPLYYTMLFLYNIMAGCFRSFLLIQYCIQPACIACIAVDYSAVQVYACTLCLYPVEYARLKV